MSANGERPIDAMLAGEIFVDLIMSGFERWPEPGTEAYARHFHREIGGGAPITAAGMARLGSRAGVFGVVGGDWGEWVIRRLRQYGVDTSDVLVEPDEPTGFTVVASAPEDRAFLTYGGANYRFREALREAVEEGAFRDVRHVHLACAPPLDTAADLVDAIHGNGCTVSLDVGWHRNWLGDPRSLALLRDVDMFFPNEVEAQLMTGEEDPKRILACFLDAGAQAVVLKLGGSGSALLWEGRIYREEACPVSPCDTTGAGDCFDAGFLHYWLQGAPPETCLRAANICGAVSTEAYGGIAGFPTLERLERELGEAE